MTTQDWSLLGWTSWILQSKGLSRVFSNHSSKSINSSALSFLYSPTLTSIHAVAAAAAAAKLLQSCLTLGFHGLQHARPSCPSPTPRVYSNLCPLRQWCHPTISSSVMPFSSCPQSFPASGSFQISQLFTSGGQSIGVSASTSVFAMNTQDWSPLGWTGWISLQSKGLSRVFSNTTVQKHQFLWRSAFEYTVVKGDNNELRETTQWNSENLGI